MTCEQARDLLTGTYTTSAALAFTRHFCECHACQDFVKSLVANVSAEEGKALRAEFDRDYLPQMAEALANDPEA